MSHITKGYCKTCNKYYEGRGKLYCSNKCCKANKEYQNKKSITLSGKTTWNKGKSLQLNNALEKWRESGGEPWNKGLRGIHLSPNSEFKKDDTRIMGENNPNWKGGISSENSKIRSSPEYKQWRIDVFRRDRFSCVACGFRSHKSEEIIADHIKPFFKYPELRLDINNGRTLCIECDKKLGWNSLRNEPENYNYHFLNSQNI